MRGAARRSRRRDEGGVRDADQPAERGQVTPILLAIVTFGRFQDAGMPGEALVVQEQAKRFLSQLSFADVRVSIDPRPEPLLRVVEMEETDSNFCCATSGCRGAREFSRRRKTTTSPKTL